MNPNDSVDNLRAVIQDLDGWSRVDLHFAILLSGTHWDWNPSAGFVGAKLRWHERSWLVTVEEAVANA
jgi:hypothetical protein